MKVSLLLLTFFFVAVLGDASGHWALKHCPDYQTCSSYVEECMTYFNQIVSGSSISAECLLYRRCPVGYEYLSDAEINEEKCLRVDSGGLQETLGNYEIPAVLDPYISFEDCMVSGTSVTGYSRSGSTITALSSGSYASPATFGGECFDPYQETLMYVLSNILQRDN